MVGTFDINITHCDVYSNELYSNIIKRIYFSLIYKIDENNIITHGGIVVLDDLSSNTTNFIEINSFTKEQLVEWVELNYDLTDIKQQLIKDLNERMRLSIHEFNF